MSHQGTEDSAAPADAPAAAAVPASAAPVDAAVAAAQDERARQRRKRPDSASESSEEPTAEGQEPEPGWKGVADYGVASDRNARFRRTMEDAHVAIDDFVGPGSAFFAVYDGHGGRGAVNYVQEHLHLNMREQLELGTEIHAAWKAAFLKTDADMPSGDVGYSGSTVAAALVRVEGGKRFLHTANCGDARIVLCRDGKAKRMTVDHKGTDPAEVKRIQDAGGLVVLNRVSGVLAVTRSLGDLKMKEYVIGDPYCESLELLPTDTHLVVACDGLWDVVSDQEVCDTMLAPAGDGPATAQALANRLLVKAIKQGTTDNISIIVCLLPSAAPAVRTSTASGGAAAVAGADAKSVVHPN